MSRKLGLLSLALCATVAASAQQYTFSYQGIAADIPDQNPFGLTDVRTISVGPGITITDIDVSLTISGTGSGGFNGDLYVTLQHESGYSVLLNRPGARPEAPSGYSDSGVNVTFDDSVERDIHSYRLVLSGNENTPIAGALTGAWAPDGRNVDPSVVSPSSPRNSLLTSFNGSQIDGPWALYVSDLSAGGTHRLESWSLSVQTVPEPSPVALAGLSVLIAFGFRKIWANVRSN